VELPKPTRAEDVIGIAQALGLDEFVSQSQQEV